MIKIIRDREILHRTDTRGIVVTREQVIEIDGVRFVAHFWTNFDTGSFHHVDSNPEVSHD